MLLLIMGLLQAGSLTVLAQELGYWRATSSTAQSITGDIAFSDAKLLINFTAFPIVQARDLAPAEVSAVFDADSNSGAKGHLYKIDVPAQKKFLHKNTLCGQEDVQWMATFVQGRSLSVAFFSGQKPPMFTLDAIQNSTSLCGTFFYSR
ncbi:hypothetical protein [Pseudacidobacterium ailaaui]|uniref:hypothetical protein n=1 Tax=Pseudacidobacterium ailaaui TaxID=1382359 RepID=UPI001EE32F52|nr:hypothetical protein [Pseudacidobacterium ailaaui]MDI3254540.1 hypothetical protein [Bacillota bacterium]